MENICVTFRLLFAYLFRQRDLGQMAWLWKVVLLCWCLTEYSFHVDGISMTGAVTDDKELLSKYVGAWNVRCVEVTGEITHGLSEIQFVSSDWFDERLIIGGITIRTIIAIESAERKRFDCIQIDSLTPFAFPMKGKVDMKSQTVTFDSVERLDNAGEEMRLRQVWTIPKDGTFAVTVYSANAEGFFSKIKTMEYSQSPFANQAHGPAPVRELGREDLQDYLGDWEIVSEIDTEGLQLPVRSEGGATPDGDPKAFMRIANNYLTEVPWDRIKDPETVIRESAYVVEWGESGRKGMRGELFYEFKGAREHVGSCIIKVVGKRALLRIDQPPLNSYEDPFASGQIVSNELKQFQIFSMVRTTAAGNETRK